MFNQKSIYSHNKNCHDGKKRKPELLQDEEPGKSARRTDTKQPESTRTKEQDDFASTTIPETVDASTMEDDCVGDDIREEMWMELRLSPQKQNKNESLLLIPGSKNDDETKRNLFSGKPSPSQGTSLRDFGNVHSTTFFNADINGSGVADIVALCQFGISAVGKDVHPSDVQYVTDMGNFVHGLSQMQRHDLSRLLRETVTKIKRDTNPNNTRKWKTHIPTNPTEMRKQFWEGRQSFLGNVPYPTVHSIDNLHGYVSLRECIRNRLAFGFPLEKVECPEGKDTFSTVRSVMQSESSQRVLRKCVKDYKEPVLVLLLKEWQDGYDPHSFSKTNRGSSWIKVITIAEPHEHKNCPEVSSHFVHFETA